MSFTSLATRVLPDFVLGWLQIVATYICEHKLSAIVVCRLIPSHCPFERDVELGPVHLHIPPMCRLNPLYEVFVMLRFRALCFLDAHQQEFAIDMETLI